MNPWEMYGAPQEQPTQNPWEMYTPEPAPEKSGFFADVGKDLRARAEKYGNVLKSEEPALGKAYLALGQSAGLANDVMGRTISAVTPDFIGEPLAKAGGYVLNTIGSLPSMGGGTIGEKIPAELATLEQNNPRAAEYARATGNIGSLLAATRVGTSKPVSNAASATAKAGTKVVKQGAGFVDDAAKTAGTYYKQNIAKYSPDISSENVRKVGGDLFKKATQEGGEVSPQIADKYRMKVLSTLNLEGEAKLYSSSPVAERLVKSIDDFMGKPMSFETAKAIDESLGDLAYATADNFGKLDSTGKKFLDLQHDLRNAMDTLPNSETINAARKFWSSSLKMRDLERIMERAGNAEQPATVLKNGFGSLLNSKKITNYSPAEVAAIRKASKTGIVTDALRLAGSGLVPIGAGVAGGIPGAAAGLAIQQGSKAIGVARQMGRAKNAYSTIAKESLDVPGKLTMKQIMALPPDQAKLYLKK